MSYTAPQYVDTKEQAVLALASTIKGEAVTGGDGSVNRALDILADVLAEQDVQVPQTDAGAILALAQYASGMVKPEGTIAITENGEGIDVAQYATADVSVSGGGGGDFTTATVTVVPSGETTNAQLSYLGVCTTAELQGQTFAASKPMGPDLYFDVILYNGASMLNVKAGANFSIVSTSGAIQQMNAMTYMITGDCTITVS